MGVVKQPPLTENALSLITERIFYWASPGLLLGWEKPGRGGNNRHKKRARSFEQALLIAT